MTTTLWVIRCTSENISREAGGGTLWASCWPWLYRRAHWPNSHPSGPCLCRALQRLRLGDDVRDAAHRFRHSRVCLWVLQSRWIQQKLGPRERWEHLHEHESTWMLLNIPSMQNSDLEHSRYGLSHYRCPHTDGSGSSILLAIPYNYGLLPSSG